MTNARSPAAERVEVALSRISGEAARAFTEVYSDSARREANAADERAASGVTRGPLDGRIVSVKALFDVAGSVTTAGSAVLKGLPPAEGDADVVQRLRAAGAIVIGKTQMTEFAFSALGTNPHDGTPGNPRDPNRAPGGSSSGAVVSVIKGIADVAIGSDTGGSIRIPAALSGAVGFKPTGGRISTEGAFSLSSTLDTIGPIAMSVSDCAMADDVLSGGPAAPFAAAEANGFRLSIARGRLFDRCDSEVLAAFESAVAAFRKAGLDVSNRSIDAALGDVERIDKIGTFPSVEVGATLAQVEITDLSGVDPMTRPRVESGATVRGVDYVRMTRLRQQAVRSFERSFSENEFLIVPTTPIVAPLLSTVQESAGFHAANGLVLRNPRIANLLDCPSLSLPIPTAGLPVGLMLIGRRNSDRRLLEVAACLEAIVGRYAGAPR